MSAVSLSLCVVSPCCCISEDTLQTLDNEMELIERSVLLKSIIIVTFARRLCNARRLSVCLSETLDNEMELIERSVLLKLIIIVTSARRLCNAQRLSVCLSVCLSVL